VRVVRDLKDPPRRLLDQARVRDGAFDIGMFRSYWERAAKVAGERIADLSARPTAVAAEPAPDQLPASPGREAVDSSTTLPGLIRRALESADQLAAATRRQPTTTAPAGRRRSARRQRSERRHPAAE
jgi:stearoyl-CoA desaturase (Delta-9 desaturase)